MCDTCNCCDDDSDYSTSEDLYALSIDQYGVVYRLNKETGDVHVKANETLKKPDGSVEYAYYWKRVLDEHEFTRYKAERERVLKAQEAEKTAKMVEEAAKRRDEEIKKAEKAKAEEEAKENTKKLLEAYRTKYPYLWLTYDYTVTTK